MTPGRRVPGLSRTGCRRAAALGTLRGREKRRRRRRRRDPARGLPQPVSRARARARRREHAARVSGPGWLTTRTARRPRRCRRGVRGRRPPTRSESRQRDPSHVSAHTVRVSDSASAQSTCGGAASLSYPASRPGGRRLRLAEPCRRWVGSVIAGGGSGPAGNAAVSGRVPCLRPRSLSPAAFPVSRAGRAGGSGEHQQHRPGPQADPPRLKPGVRGTSSRAYPRDLPVPVGVADSDRGTPSPQCLPPPGLAHLADSHTNSVAVATNLAVTVAAGPAASFRLPVCLHHPSRAAGRCHWQTASGGLT